MADDTAIEMFVGGLMLDPNTQNPVVILKDESGQVTLPIWIGIAEATSIASAIKQVTMHRPLTHDLMYDVLNELGVKVERIVITELRDATYFAELVLSYGEKALLLDSRPSDAIAIALRGSAPIYVTQKVLDQSKHAMAGMPQPPGTAGQQPAEESEAGEGDPDDESRKDLSAVDKDKWEDILNELDPDDFKYKM